MSSVFFFHHVGWGIELKLGAKYLYPLSYLSGPQVLSCLQMRKFQVKAIHSRSHRWEVWSQTTGLGLFMAWVHPQPGWLRTPCNYSSKDVMPSPGLRGHLREHAAHPDKQVHIHVNITSNKQRPLTCMAGCRLLLVTNPSHSK